MRMLFKGNTCALPSETPCYRKQLFAAAPDFQQGIITIVRYLSADHKPGGW